jgi:tetratricopeptide (TPR) repeat protein
MRTSSVCLSLAVLIVSAPASAQLPTEVNARAALEHYLRGQSLLSAERWERAVDEFAAAIRLHPLLTDAHYGLGHAYLALQRYASAVQAFERCLAAARTLHGAYQRPRVEHDEDIEQLDGAFRERDVHLERLPLFAEASRPRRPMAVTTAFEPPAPLLLSLGSAHFRNGDPLAAEQYWTDAIRVNDRLGEAWNNLAIVYKNTARKAAAAAALRRAERVGFHVHPRLRDEIRSMK